MKVLLVYWVVGCVLIGLAFGRIVTECPKDKLEIADMVGSIAIWPAFFAMAVARTGEPPLVRGCKVLQ